ncbi:hypothetical protein Q3G72_014717 [Acer saccharum]|nr:hypothetical protein Q3G72_014717 [Acer saccharum]
MASRFQAAALVAAPSCPNAVVWSEENLIAVASGHLVTILNPALLYGPKGLITLPAECEPYEIGVVKREDLLSNCLLSTCLNRDRRPFVRSVSWSPIGMAPNAGCLLAVCTTEGRVKIYRPPFCDIGSEWIEVMDISDGLYRYLENNNFGEDATEHASVDDIPNSVPRKERKRRRVNVSGVINNDSSSSVYTNVGTFDPARGFEIRSGQLKEKISYQIIDVSKAKGKPVNKISNNCTLPMITADQYASRSAILHSLVLAWSPVLKLPSSNCPVPPNGSSNCFSVLAVGGRSGKISFWRISMPECYSVEHSKISTSTVLIGLLQAHNSWITTISWAMISSDSSNPQVLLVTGSSDGSVRIWRYGQELLNLTEVELAPFSLLKEVITVNTVPILVLSIIVPVQSPHQILLAVGKGSGSFEVWICDVSSSKYEKAGSYDAHDQAVTGLAWVFGGRCLYSCSQDNVVRSWILRGSFLSDVPIPSITPGLKSSTDLPDVFFSCLGVAVSPGNLVIAMVRSFDLDTLDHMYEARAQKAAVEFLWIGGQQIDALSGTFPEYGLEAFPDFSKKGLVSWVDNILWSLKQFEHLDKPLVVWDVIAALLAFKRSVPKYVECILVKWLSTLHPESQEGLSPEKILSHVSKNVSNISSRRLHLLNIICRCVILSELKADQVNSKLNNLEGLSGSIEEQLDLWMVLLSNSERELRDRLVGFSFSAFLYLTSHSASSFSHPGCWYPVGIAQMEQWVARNHEHIRNELKVLASEVVEHKTRIRSGEYTEEEQCSYCSASVLFDSLDSALCQGSEECIDGVCQTHKLVRCAVSMQVCPTTPLWFCKCCHRWSYRLAPECLFTMPSYPLDFKHRRKSSTVEEEISKPLCPFCGILLQRLQPEFLLSASPV